MKLTPFTILAAWLIATAVTVTGLEIYAHSAKPQPNLFASTPIVTPVQVRKPNPSPGQHLGHELRNHGECADAIATDAPLPVATSTQPVLLTISRADRLALIAALQSVPDAEVTALQLPADVAQRLCASHSLARGVKAEQRTVPCKARAVRRERAVGK